jgi:transglutaminase-like putative cysteine protease
MKYRITHRTEYDYNLPVKYCHNLARLIPRETANQQCLERRIETRPKAEDTAYYLDAFGNRVLYFSITAAHENFSITSESLVEVNEQVDQPGLFSEISLDEVQRLLRTDINPETLSARQFVLDSPYIKRSSALFDYGDVSLQPDQPVTEAVYDLMERIHHEFEYDPHFTDNATPLEKVLDHKRGVCQDFAHLAIACLRSHGLASRYVSGYLETRSSSGGAKLVGADASHAWFSVYIPGSGWLDFDPTNNQIPMGRHITLAWGRDYSDVPPLKGILFGGGGHGLKVSVDVVNLDNPLQSID